MRDYQRMAPHKLTDGTLESILWNKVPIELQQEVKEITDGSVQELLQRLLRAEAALAEQKRSQCTEVIPRMSTGSKREVIDRLTGQLQEIMVEQEGEVHHRHTIRSASKDVCETD